MSALQAKRRIFLEREIAATAMRLFGERGFDQVTVDEIAGAVGISSRTFFRYFETKEDLVLQYQRRIHARLVEAFMARPPGEGAVTALRQAYLATSHVEAADREQVLATNRFLPQSRTLRVRTHGERIDDRAEVMAELARRLGRGADDADIETIAVAMSAAASAAFQRWLADGGLGDPAQQIARSLDVLMSGLAQFDQPPGKS
jgi:AcrR family transcriptional regulator